MAGKGLTRRSVLHSLLLGAGSLAGCIRTKPQLVCPKSPGVSFPRGPLTIDAHCHVFNGTDLQVANFISKVIVRQDSQLAAVARLMGNLKDFIDLFSELRDRPDFRAAGLTDLASRFFGGNAVNWLGLRKGEPTRVRLDAFYRRHGVPDSDWMTKVDKM